MARVVAIFILQCIVQASRVHHSERFQLAHGLKTAPSATVEASSQAEEEKEASVLDPVVVDAEQVEEVAATEAAEGVEAKKPDAAIVAASVVEVEASTFDASGSPSAADVLREMGRGINLGQIYEVQHGGNDPSFEAQRSRIDHLQRQGFRHIRLPVTWGDRFNHNDQKTHIVEELVRHADRQGMFVVLNAHAENWLKDHYDGSDRFDRPWYELWRNIAQKFQNVGARLVFELLNEPAGALGGSGGRDPRDHQAIELTRRVNQVAYDAVRSVDNDRVVLVMPNGHGNHGMARYVYPDPGALPGRGQDPWVGVSVHSYDPNQFCAENGRNDYIRSVQDLEEKLSKGHAEVIDWARRTRIPVHLGEYGVGRDSSREHERNSDEVRDYYRFMTRMFNDAGIQTTVWDDQQRYAIMRGHDFLFGLAENIIRA